MRGTRLPLGTLGAFGTRTSTLRRPAPPTKCCIKRVIPTWGRGKSCLRTVPWVRRCCWPLSGSGQRVGIDVPSLQRPIGQRKAKSIANGKRKKFDEEMMELEDFGGHCCLTFFNCRQCVRLHYIVTKKTKVPAARKGHLMYIKFRNVVYSKENMRFVADPEWGQLLGHARRGEWKLALKNIISSRTHPNFSTREFTNIFTRSQTHIVAFHTYMIAKLLQRSQVSNCPNKTFAIVAEKICCSDKTVDVRQILQLPDNATGGVPMVLLLYVGMEVKFRANQYVSKVAKSAFVKIYHIIWPPNCTFQMQPNSTYVSSDAPINIYVTEPSELCKLVYLRRGRTILSHWPEIVTPQPPQRLLKKCLIQQFPIVPSFATTCHAFRESQLTKS
ncbi:hypothetical protein DFS34DRAFT_619594 [Phlyctochytrium arcticum]|nr:hypothetical protein DFS34DRAFT_619594 [Phlyctochytrium arcticum]